MSNTMNVREAAKALLDGKKVRLVSAGGDHTYLYLWRGAALNRQDGSYWGDLGYLLGCHKCELFEEYVPAPATDEEIVASIKAYASRYAKPTARMVYADEVAKALRVVADMVATRSAKLPGVK